MPWSVRKPKSRQNRSSSFTHSHNGWQSLTDRTEVYAAEKGEVLVGLVLQGPVAVVDPWVMGVAVLAVVVQEGGVDANSLYLT